MDLIIQKTTELGIDEIQPIICERSIVKIKKEKLEKKLSHWRQVSISACEQCGRAKIPKIHEPENIIKYLEKIIESDEDTKIILSPEASKSLDNITPDIKQDIKVLIGPEGDFTTSEVKQAFDAGFQGLDLGEFRLRTETAAIVAVTKFQ